MYIAPPSVALSPLKVLESIEIVPHSKQHIPPPVEALPVLALIVSLYVLRLIDDA